MNARLSRLESLLSRVQARRTRPRATGATPTAANPVPELELDEPGESVLPPAPERQVAAAQSAPDSVPQSINELDMDDFEEVTEGAPESGQAVANFQNQEAESSPPITPPPESGEEIANPDIPRHSGPTPEQIGATISLDEGGGENFELDEPTLDAPASSLRNEQLEADFPSHGSENQKSHESAMTDLQRVRLGKETPIEARVSTRPLASTNVVDYIEAAKSFAPKSLVELLDASLSLE